MKKISILILLFIISSTLSGCGFLSKDEEPLNFKVSFDSTGGSNVEDYYVSEGDIIVKPTDPLKDGFIFDGWFIDISFNDSWDFNKNIVTNDFTLYAKWSELIYVPEGNPISTAIDLQNFILKSNNESYYLTNDIDMSGIILTGSSKIFSGVLDGQGYTIRNSVINATSNKKGFLFKELIDGATIKNIIFEDSIHNGGGTSESAAFISAFAQGGVTIDNILFKNVSVIHDGSYAGLIFGDVINEIPGKSIDISNITVMNDDNNRIEGLSYCGGLIGSSRKPVTINVSNIYFDSSVVATDQAAGSIMGRFNSPGITLNLEQIVIKGTVTSNKNVGMILGTGLSGSTVNANHVFISDMIATTQTDSINTVVGNTVSTSITTSNIFYDNETTSLLIKDVIKSNIIGESLSNSAITKEWFNGTDFDKEFFKYNNQSIFKNYVFEGPVEEVGISVVTAHINPYYLIGESLDLSELTVKVLYNDTTSEILNNSEYTINTISFDNSNIGTYQISVTYGDFTKTFDVYVIDVTHIEVEEMFVKTTYNVNDTINTNGIVVKAILSNGSYLRLTSEDYNIDTSLINFTLSGTYPLNINYKNYNPVEIDIIVTDAILTAIDNTVKISIDKTFEDTIGSEISGIPTFNTFKSALQYLDNQSLTDEIEKIIFVHAGTYTEKIIVNIPNITLIGEDKNTTKLTYDAASGMERPEGGTWGTQGSATISIKSSAINFMAKNITFANHFDYNNNTTVSSKQAVALVNEADKVIFHQVQFLGFQDTLYAKNGRQLYNEVYIEGVVDFIFGNGGPAFFESSTIHSLLRSSGCLSTNKGFPSNETALVEYGYVFYQNTYTFEEGVPEGSVDLGRPWAQTAAIAYINNTFDSHISVRGWTIMSGNVPENARFFEYQNQFKDNSTRHISEAATELNSTSAKLYIDKDIVFGQMNGDIDFGSTWNYASDFISLQTILFE